MKSRMFTYITGLAIFAALMVTFGPGAQGQASGKYTVQELPDLGGLAGAASINDLGWAAGESNPPNDLSDQAIVWRSGQLTQLGTLGGFNSSVAFPNKNEIGWLVGASETPQNDPYQENFCGFSCSSSTNSCVPINEICNGFLWRSETNEMIALPPLKGGNNSNALGANNQRQVVGVAETGVKDSTCASPQVFRFQAVVWSLHSNGAPFVSQRLAPLDPDNVSAAFGINKYGDIVGASGACGPFTSATARHALLWQHGSVSPTDLGSLGGAINNVADALNNVGQIVGFSDLPEDNVAHPFLWQGGVMTDLGTLQPGDTFAFAESINDSGEVVGSSCGKMETKPATAGNCHGFHWQAGVMIDLNSVLPANSPLVIANAADINSSGQIAVQAWDKTLQKQVAAVLIPGDK